MKVFVAGSGTMGSGIAQTFCTQGHEVWLFDQEMSFIDRGCHLIQTQLQRQLAKGRLSEVEVGESLGRIHKTLNPVDAADADLVIEAIFELMAAKRDIFESFDEICHPSCLFASNTSSLSITEMARGFKHETQFVGFHFFNPAPVMKLIEIIPGSKTSAEAVVQAMNIAAAIGKEPVLCKESPGFIVNRILVPLINEAADLLETGVATAEDIDKAMKLGANHPMGPLELGDLIGLDVCLNIMLTLFAETGDPKYRPSLLLKRKVRAGQLGRKTGEGFHRYAEGK